MPRRIALALALGFTVIVTFSIVTVGARAGLFGRGHDANAEVADPAAGPPPQLAVIPSAAAPPAAPDPVVVTQYVYVDDPAPAAAQPSSTGAAATAPSPQPTATTATPRERQTAPAPTATRPSAPTSTPAAAQQPSPTAPSSPPKELEFVGTVTAIDGQSITFSYSGGSVVVRVSSATQLNVGDRAHVHAKLSGGAYVATEVESGK